MPVLTYHGYWYHFTNWVSQTINTLILSGHHDTGISSRAWAERHEPGWGRVQWLLDKVFGEGHCEAAWLADVEGANEVLLHDEYLQDYEEDLLE